jgi:PLP dependent protein
MATKSNIQEILKDIKNKNILLAAVTKTRTIEEIKEAIGSGIMIIAENKVQEAEKKYDELEDLFRRKEIEFHFIGHLQSNKIKKAVEMFDVIQTVDSLKLSEDIDKRAKEIGKTQRIFIEVNIGREHQKSGVMPEKINLLVDEIKKLKNIRLEGLMCIPPHSENKEDSRKYFSEMKKIFDQLHLRYLSMGMSNDYLIAIEEGSNMIRIGRGIFGDRL